MAQRKNATNAAAAGQVPFGVEWYRWKLEVIDAAPSADSGDAAPIRVLSLTPDQAVAKTSPTAATPKPDRRDRRVTR